MLKLNKNKDVFNSLNKLAISITKDDNICDIARYAIGNSKLDRDLENYYRGIGLKDYKVNVSHKLITEMPFNKNIDLSFMKKSKNYKTYKIPKYKYEPINYPIYDRECGSYTPFVRFDKDIVLPMICEDNVGWMTLVLFEETTMRPCVEKARGNVLVFGLGIGFFVYNCLLKDDVKKITIIEYNQDIIDLFKENILPQFPRQCDVEIIHGDAYDYCKNEYINRFDYTFVDIWRNDSDGVLILSNIFKGLDFNEELNIDFWIEDAILHHVTTSLAIYLIQLSRGKLSDCLKGYVDEERTEENFITFDKIHRYFRDKNVMLNTADGVLNLINDKAVLRDMLKSF